LEVVDGMVVDEDAVEEDGMVEGDAVVDVVGAVE
jgi:hypothetical protein